MSAATVKRAVGRREFLGQAAIGGAALGAFGGLQVGSADAAKSPSPAQDRQILNFALLLEYLQASFYRAALARDILRGEAREFAEVVETQERQHLALLRRALGRNARRPPTFSFEEVTKDQAAFVRTAVVLEDAAVAAYNGQAANLTKRALGPALRIVSVEGRHAAWIRDVAGLDPAPFAADPGKSARDVSALLRRARLLRP